MKVLNKELGNDIELVFGIVRKTAINHIKDSYLEAVEAVRYGKRLDKISYINYSELGVERLWQKIDKKKLDYYVQIN